MTREDMLIFTPRTMLEAVLQFHQPASFLKDTFFPTVRYSDTELIDLPKLIGNRQYAPYVSHGISTLVDNTPHVRGFYPPAYVSLKKLTSAWDMLRSIDPNTHPYSPQNAMIQDRALKQFGMELIDSHHKISRTEERMCSQVLLNGSVNIEGEGVKETIDFGMPASHKIELTGDDLFTSANSDPVNFLTEISQVIGSHQQNTIGSPNTVVFGRRAYNAFMKHPKVVGVDSVLNNRNIFLGTINIDDSKIPKVRSIGNFDGRNHYAYFEQHTSPYANIDEEVIPPDYIYLGNTNAGNLFCYAVVATLDFEQQKELSSLTPIYTGGKISPYRFPRSWRIPEPDSMAVTLSSAFLAVMVTPAAFASIKVV